jgi:Ni/Fe-hydrogenase 1 B-type cytochrome subunit
MSTPPRAHADLWPVGPREGTAPPPRPLPPEAASADRGAPRDLQGVADLPSDVRPVAAKQTAIYVYDTPVRVWHWVNALCIVVLAVTGYLIASPPTAAPGEAFERSLMGHIRFVHFAAGQLLAVALVLRLVWAFIGNRYAHQLFCPPIWRRHWWWEVWFEAKWYGFLVRDPKKYIGHNPFAALMMFVLFILPCLFMVLSGMALYAQAAGTDSWQHAAFGWMLTLFGNPMRLQTLHHLGMWVLVVFSILHIYAAIHEELLSRQSMLSTIVSGWRMFRDDAP